MVADHLDYRTNPELADVDVALSGPFVSTVIKIQKGNVLPFADIKDAYNAWRLLNGLPYLSDGQIGYWLGMRLGRAGFIPKSFPVRSYLDIGLEPRDRWPKLSDMILPVNVSPPEVDTNAKKQAEASPELEPGMVPELDIDLFIRECISVNDQGRVYRSDVVIAYRYWVSKKAGHPIQVSSTGPQMKRFDFLCQLQGFLYRMEGHTQIIGLVLNAPDGCPPLRRSALAPTSSYRGYVVKPTQELIDEFIESQLHITKNLEDWTYPADLLEALEGWLSLKYEEDVSVDYSDRVYQLVSMRLKREGKWGFKSAQRVYRGVLLK